MQESAHTASAERLCARLAITLVQEMLYNPTAGAGRARGGETGGVHGGSAAAP